jgi:aspartate-semialdehyde dehydrogenase
MKKIPVGILGATGMVGQHYVNRLAHHPWFEIAFMASSEQSAGKSYAEALAGRWRLPTPIPDAVKNIPLKSPEAISVAKQTCTLIFSAVGNEAAALYEENYALAGLRLISNASLHRFAPDVPMLIPEINPHHLAILPIQQANRKWKEGFIVTKPNCSLQSYMIPLWPLHLRYTIKQLLVTTMQAVSGAGYPGISSLDIIDNVIPHIAKEEEKSEQEPLKILGSINGNSISPAQGIAISAHCNRVPVQDGHMACVSVKFEQKPSLDEILFLWNTFQGLPQEMNLPTAPFPPIIYKAENDRPQPRLDRHEGHGMGVVVGRLRPCPVLDYRFVALSHNTIRGAAGGGVLNGELLMQQGYLN